MTPHEASALLQARASASEAFGSLQVLLLRDLVVRLKGQGQPAERTLPLEACTDQLEAAVRTLRTRLPTPSEHGR
ncbi:MAG: hypothetical protein SYR96_05560 [Actinomycetota bacterium]|nr:hypothetical protein [Actinomycetota bacterium]